MVKPSVAEVAVFHCLLNGVPLHFCARRWLKVIKGQHECFRVCVCSAVKSKPIRMGRHLLHCPTSCSSVWPGRVSMSNSIAVSCIPGQRPSVHSQWPGQLPPSSLTAALYRPLQVLDPLFPPSRVQTKPCYCLPTNKRAVTFFFVSVRTIMSRVGQPNVYVWDIFLCS